MSAGSRVLVLNYHHVHDGDDPSFRVTPQQLEAQLAHLQGAGFRFLTLQEMIEQKGWARAGGKEVLITFDDGYETFLSQAWPILQRRKVPCTLFLISSYVGKWNDWDGLRRARHRHLSASQLQMLATSVPPARLPRVDFGSHSRTHPVLTRLSKRRLAQELSGSQRVLERLLQRPIRAFAYPGGHVDDRVRAATAQWYELAFATALDGNGDGDWRYCIPRIDASFCQLSELELAAD